MRLKDKVAVITGAGAGMGRSVALRFSKEGAKVVVVDINEKKGKDTVASVTKTGRDAIFIKADVSKTKEVKNMFKVTIEKYGALHILYNNAGIFLREIDNCVTEVSEETWDRFMDVNLKSVFLCSKYGIPEIIKSGGGSVINVSSSAGIIASKNVDSYTATKGAIISLTRSMAVEYASQKVHINCIVPCGIDTPMLDESRKKPGWDEEKHLSKIPARRFGRPEEVANMALFLASDEAAYVVGAIFVIDGGITSSL